ncbi:hypothetical protein GCM10027059_42920 [Myceligenerans halotolerans]
MADSPVFPGGTSVSHLRVYDWPTPDAPGGSGTPHFHTTSTEAYVALAGRGRVETLGPRRRTLDERGRGRHGRASRPPPLRHVRAASRLVDALS